MTADLDLQLVLSAWFDDATTSSPPADLLGRSLARVDRTRQRPAWLAFGQAQARTRGIGLAFSPVWIVLILVALVALVIVASGARLFLSPAIVVDATPSPSLIPVESISLTPRPSLTPPTSRMWTSAGSPIETRFGESATLLADGDVLLAAGESEFADHGFARASAELFDPATGRWTLTGSLRVGRSGHTAVRLADGRVLILGGYTSLTPGSGAPTTSSAEVYDPETAAWRDTGAMKDRRVDATATLLNDGRVLVTGGISSGVTNGPLSTAEIYDARLGIWSRITSMSAARTSHTATLLPDGRVLVVGGGCCGRPALASAEIFDPTAGTWTVTGSLGGARRWHTSTLLGDGLVLVFGGDDNGVASTTAELFDPATGKWTATAAPVSDGEAVLLQDGRVLVKGSQAGEVYDPATGSWTGVGGPIDGRADHTLTLLLDGRVLVTYVEAAAVFDPTGQP